MIDISWSQFDRNQSAKDISFESFCYHIAYIRFKEFGFFSNFYNTPGSEFYLVLHKDCPELNLKSGDEIGWQVKWWFDTEENTSLITKRRDELIRGFKTTLIRHPNINSWIICTPGNLVEDTFSDLQNKLKELSNTTNFINWNKTTFNNFLFQNSGKYSTVFNYYFN